MHQLRKFFLLTAAVWLAPLLLRAQSGTLVGKWQCPFEGYTMELDLKPDGSGTLDGAPIRYQTAGTKLTVTEADQTVNVYDYRLAGGQLLVSGGDLDGQLTFKKAGGGGGLGGRTAGAVAKGNVPKSSTNTNAPPKAASNPLLGAWTGATGTFVFNASGQGTANGAPMTYTTQGDQLTLNDGTANVTLRFEVNGATLALTGPGGTLSFTKGAVGSTAASAGGRSSAGQELVGKWCYLTSNYNSLGSTSNSSATEECIVIKADGTYEFSSESSRSAGSATYYGGTSSSDYDTGTWRYDGGSTISVTSQKTGAHSYTLEKRNHPKTGDPMIFIDGRGYVTFYQKPGW